MIYKQHPKPCVDCKKRTLHSRWNGARWVDICKSCAKKRSATLAPEGSTIMPGEAKP